MEPKLESDRFDEEGADLCRKLLDKNEKTRIGANGCEEIMAHPWFTCINWNAIYEKKQQAPYKPQLDNEYCTKHFPQEFTQMKLTPQDVQSLKDNSKWADFTYEDDSIGLEKVDDGTGFWAI